MLIFLLSKFLVHVLAFFMDIMGPLFRLLFLSLLYHQHVQLPILVRPLLLHLGINLLIRNLLLPQLFRHLINKFFGIGLNLRLLRSILALIGHTILLTQMRLILLSIPTPTRFPLGVLIARIMMLSYSISLQLFPKFMLIATFFFLLLLNLGMLKIRLIFLSIFLHCP